MNTYAIRVEGHLDDHWSAWLDGVEMTRDDDGATTVTVEVADQAQLHGVLAGLRDIGAVISELRANSATAPPVLGRPLRTERLILRPATVEDAEPTWKYRRLTGCSADLDGYRERFTQPGRLATTVIVTLGDARIIGDFMLRRAERGWALDPAYAGHGYATEAARELLRHCFEDLGMRRELHAVRESLRRSGEWLDTLAYAILDDESRARQRSCRRSQSA